MREVAFLEESFVWRLSSGDCFCFSQAKKLSTKVTFLAYFFRNKRGRIKLTFLNGLSHTDKGTFFVIFLVSLAGSAEKSNEKADLLS